jgi:uncharacterized C2H2 Zn-finger protein
LVSGDRRRDTCDAAGVLPFAVPDFADGAEMSDDGKVLYRCPVCERTFRVPVSFADRVQCLDCERLAEAKQAEKRAAVQLRADRAAAEKAASRKREIEKLQNAALQEGRRLRSYSVLNTYGLLTLAVSAMGLFAGAGMTITALQSSRGNPAVGIGLVLASVGGLAFGQLILLAIHVASDIEQSKKHQERILELMQLREGSA